MKINDLINSKYLRKEDFPEPALLTVKEVRKENVSAAGQDPEEKGVMYFRERAKGMVLNPTNLKRAARIFGSGETDDWEGKRVVVFTDELVEFGGNVVGGLRLRAPSPPTAKNQPAPNTRDLSSIESDIPL
jgi:hypothetical protein